MVRVLATLQSESRYVGVMAERDCLRNLLETYRCWISGSDLRKIWIVEIWKNIENLIGLTFEKFLQSKFYRNFNRVLTVIGALRFLKKNKKGGRRRKKMTGSYYGN